MATNRITKNLLLTLVLASFLQPAQAADGKVEETVTKNLASIASAETRGAMQSCAIQGTLRFKILVGGSGLAVGSWGRVSDHGKSNFVMRFGGGDWRGEQFIFDGEKTSFAKATASHQYSDFAKFVAGHDFIVKDGLLGGVLSTAWALQKPDQSGVRLEYMGRKKMDGRELETLQYFPKAGSDMSVKLYFDPETYRHVMTVYSAVNAPSGVRHGITSSAEQQELRFTIEERFSDFQSAEGVTLPHHYDLQFSEELQSGTTRVYDFDMTADAIHENIGLDPENFRIK